jgi:lysophospholipase L1-like esterase
MMRVLSIARLFSHAILASLLALLVMANSRGEEPKNGLRLILPSVIYATEGIEANVYLDNVVLTTNPANYAFDVICSKGRQQQERWVFTPRAEDAGKHPFALEIRNDRNELVGRAESSLLVSPPAAGQDKAVSMLLIGDSLTHASVYSQRLLDLGKQPDGPRIDLIGSFGLGTPLGANRHEGYGGWTAQRFATHFTGTAREGEYTKRGSPFLYASEKNEKKLDFVRYCQDVSSGNFPNYVTIFLGPNDIFSATDENLEQTIETMLKHYDELIAMVRSASPKTTIGSMLPVPPAASQDAFGSNYAAGQTRWQYKRNQHRLVERMLERYGSQKVAGVEIVPTHLNLDCVHNYPAESIAPNAHATEKISRQNNGVHPSSAGYNQIGDTLFAWLVAKENGK